MRTCARVRRNAGRTAQIQAPLLAVPCAVGTARMVPARHGMRAARPHRHESAKISVFPRREHSGTQEQKNGGAKQRRRIFYVCRILSRRTHTGALFGKKRGGAPVPDPRKTGFSPRLRFPALPRRRLHFINLRRRSYFFAVCGGKASVTRMRVERRRTARRCEKAKKPYSP